MIKFFLILGGAAALTGCATTPQLDDKCNATEAQGYVGKQISAKVREELAQIAPDRIRYFRPLDPVTADLVFSRMNVQISDEDTIVAIYCDR